MAPDNAIEDAANNAKRPSLSATFFASAFTEGALRFRYDIDPAKHTIFAAPGDTLLGIAASYRSAMNIENPANAAHALALHNGILPANGRWQDVRLSEGQMLNIPVARGLEIVAMPVIETFSNTDLATFLKDNGRLPPSLENNPARAADVIGALNPGRGNLSVMANSMFMPIQSNVNVLVRDDFEKVQPLQTPGLTTGAKATLYISEPESTHFNTVLDFARSYSRALTPDGQTTPAILGYAEQDYGPTLSAKLTNMPRLENGTNDYLIFNHSYRRSFENLDKLMLQPEFRHLQTIHFVAAGNEADDMDSDARHNVAIPLQLGPRSYIIGAAHTNPDGTVKLADYTSVGADIVAPPVALYNGDEIGGTSFASPMMAALDQKMLQLYGGTLTQEEIMAAAYMSTSMDLTESNDLRYYQLHGFTPTPGPVDVVFETNGGGRPHNERAGAGIIDPQKWQETLNTMSGIKMRMEHVPETIHESIDVGKITPVESRDILGERIYTYSVPITQDMTLDRLALVLPQPSNFEAFQYPSEGDVTVTSPYGFTFKMPATPHGTVGTSAFALEDVKAGDFITIESRGQPLSDIAQIVINGQGDGNVIQATRDLLMEQGKMPIPLTEYAGTRFNADVEAEAAAARAALEKDKPALPTFGSALQNILTNPPEGATPPNKLPEIKF